DSRSKPGRLRFWRIPLSHRIPDGPCCEATLYDRTGRQAAGKLSESKRITTARHRGSSAPLSGRTWIRRPSWAIDRTRDSEWNVKDRDDDPAGTATAASHVQGHDRDRPLRDDDRSGVQGQESRAVRRAGRLHADLS